MKKLNLVLVILISVSLMSCSGKSEKNNDSSLLELSPALQHEAVVKSEMEEQAREIQADARTRQRRAALKDMIDQYDGSSSILDDQNNGRQKKNDQKAGSGKCDSCGSVTINNNIICGNCGGNAKHSSPPKKVNPVKKDSPSTQPEQSGNCSNGTITVNYDSCGVTLFSESFNKTGDKERDHQIYLEATKRLKRKADSLRKAFIYEGHTQTNN